MLPLITPYLAILGYGAAAFLLVNFRRYDVIAAVVIAAVLLAFLGARRRRAEKLRFSVTG